MKVGLLNAEGPLHCRQVPKRGDVKVARASLSGGVILTGQLGVGKSTVAAHIVDRYQLRLVRSVVTRPLEKGEESEYDHADSEAFICDARAGQIVLPFHFSGNWYGFRRSDWDAAVASEGVGFLFNVRPNVALIISSVLRRSIPIWLFVNDAERRRRLAQRGAGRDAGGGDRLRMDANDAAYEAVFVYRVENADVHAAGSKVGVVVTSAISRISAATHA